MRHLLNTLFITSEDIYLSLDGENVVANREKREVARYPLHTLAGIVSFFLRRSVSRFDGSLRRTAGFSGAVHPPRKISRQGFRKEQRECVAAKRAIPHSG